MDKLLWTSYQSFVLLLLSTAHHLREVDQGSSHVVTLGLLMGILVFDLGGSTTRRVSVVIYTL